MGADSQTSEVVIEDRYAVEPSVPLPHFDTGGATAVAARDLLDANHRVYALVQLHGIPRRAIVTSKLIGRTVPGLLTIRAEGIISVADGDEGTIKRLVTVLDFPAGGRLVDDPHRFGNLSERVIREKIVPPLASALATLEMLGIPHRNISLQNIFYKDKSRKDLVLGECFSSPPGFHHPAAYECIERALADPAGRGAGDASCDMYAFGAVLMSLFLGRDVAAPTPEEEEQQIDARIRFGSYWALGGSNELGGAIGELLRGLMEDNASKRWTAEEARRWVSGIYARKAVSDPGWTLVRPGVFKEKSYKDRRALAVAMLQTPQDAIKFVRGDRFRHWIEKALSEGPTADWLERSLNLRGASKAEKSDLESRMSLARLMAVLFPEGPFIYGQLRFCADGVDSYVAYLFATEDSLRLSLMRELIVKGRFSALVDVMSGRSEIMKLGSSRLSIVISHGSKVGLGFGLERCLYELNKALPCQSPRLSPYYVEDLEQLVLALEDVASKGGFPVAVIDPHVAAFTSRCSGSLDPVIYRLSSVSGQSDAYLLETIRFFARIQQKFYPKPLRHIAQALLPALKRSLEGMKGKTRRTKTLAAVEALAEVGNLARIGAELDLRLMKEQDAHGFKRAQMQLASITRIQERMHQDFTVHDPRAVLLGGRMAAWFSYVAVIVCIIAVFYRLLL